jgi:hypothetical protein
MNATTSLRAGAVTRWNYDVRAALDAGNPQPSAHGTLFSVNRLSVFG